jgi:hypothetical protein
MRKPRQFRPQADTLEPIRLLSGGLVAVPIQAAHVALHTAAVSHNIQVTGKTQGSYTSVTVNPNIGTTYTFLATPSHVTPLGSVTLTGNIQAPGRGSNDQVHGTLRLADSNGSVTLSLTGPPQKRFSQLPGVFTYKITKSSGQFGGDVGSGYMALTLSPNPTMNPTLNQSGRFTITFTRTRPGA